MHEMNNVSFQFPVTQYFLTEYSEFSQFDNTINSLVNTFQFQIFYISLESTFNLFPNTNIVK